MSTRLEGVFIPVELDTSKAQRQLDELESGIKKDSKKAVDLNRTLSMNNTLQGGGKGAKTGTTGTGGGAQTKSVFQSVANAASQASTPVSGILGKVAGIASKFSAAGAIAEGALGAAALYAGARATTSAASIAANIAEGAFPNIADSPAFKVMQDQLNNLRNSFNYIESYVKSIVTGATKTYDMSVALARVNGRLPNIITGFGVYREAEMQEDMLKKKFQYFQDREFNQALGASMAELFKDGVNR